MTDILDQAASVANAIAPTDDERSVDVLSQQATFALGQIWHQLHADGHMCWFPSGQLNALIHVVVAAYSLGMAIGTESPEYAREVIALSSYPDGLAQAVEAFRGRVTL